MGSASKSLSFCIEMVSFTINLYIFIVISVPYFLLRSRRRSTRRYRLSRYQLYFQIKLGIPESLRTFIDTGI